MLALAAHLAVRAVLHPVLARPTVLRSYLPLRALIGQLFSRRVRLLCIADIRNVYPDVRLETVVIPPREVGAPLEVADGD